MSAPLQGQKVMITAGPTREPIDSVRYISNRSSGKMGFALAEVAARAGAKVTLICGPVTLDTPSGNIKRLDVETAAEMARAADEHFPECTIAILAAAVADYTPASPHQGKMKKSEDQLTLELVKTRDIAATLGQNKQPHQQVIGFALETDNMLKNAREKLKAKNLDMIVLNQAGTADTGFQHDTNRITIIDKNNRTENFALKPKKEVAKDIIQYITGLQTA